MSAKSTFQTGLKTQLSPLLREHGFAGSGGRFHRLEGSMLHVVEVQAGGGGAGIYVNLGVHHTRLGLKKASAKSVREYACPFRTRLHDFAGGDFFPYGRSAAETETSLLCLTESMKTEGLHFFDAFAPESLPDIVKLLAKKGYTAFPALSPPAGPDAWARLAKALGLVAAAKALAAEQRAMDEAREEARRRQRVVGQLLETNVWTDELAYDCTEAACETLRPAQFAAFERALTKLPQGARMKGIVPYLRKRHAELVDRVKARHARAYGT